MRASINPFTSLMIHCSKSSMKGYSFLDNFFLCNFFLVIFYFLRNVFGPYTLTFRLSQGNKSVGVSEVAVLLSLSAGLRSHFWRSGIRKHVAFIGRVTVINSDNVMGDR